MISHSDSLIYLFISLLVFQLGSGTADASLVLFALTLLVTPANIYMLTHGAKLPPVAMEPVPIAGIHPIPPIGVTALLLHGDFNVE